MEFEAIDEGTLAKIVVPEGTADVPVNQLIAVLAGEGEDVKAAASGAGAEPATRPKPVLGRAVRRRRAPQPLLRREAAKAPRLPKPAPRLSERGSAGGRRRRTQAAANATVSARIFSSPLARRLAQDAGIDVSRIAGSGPHGRVIARDVEAARSGRDAR